VLNPCRPEIIHSAGKYMAVKRAGLYRIECGVAFGRFRRINNKTQPANNGRFLFAGEETII